MRILMIGTDRTWLSADYTGDVIERHKEYARKAGRLDVIVFSKKGFRKRKIDERVNVYPTNSSTKLNYAWDAYNIAKEIYWPEKFSLIVTQDPFLCGLAGWLIKKRFKAPLLMHFHGDFWQNKYWLFERWFNPIFLMLSKFLIDGADGIRVVSSGIRDKLVAAGIKKKKIRIIPTPVNLGKFEKISKKELACLKKKHNLSKMVINVGREDPSKDYHTLEKTVALLHQDYRKLSFCQIGRGKVGSQLKKEEGHGLFVKSFSKMRQEKLVNYYHAADVYLSSSKHESFGKVLVEAQACGLPVVATATTGSREIIEDGKNGFLVPVGDEKALARKTLYLLNNPWRSKQMGEWGKRMVEEKFNEEKTVAKIVDFWQNLAKR